MAAASGHKVCDTPPVERKGTADPTPLHLGGLCDGMALTNRKQQKTSALAHARDGNGTALDTRAWNPDTTL